MAKRKPRAGIGMVIEPTREQIARSNFKRDIVTHVDTATRTTAYRRKPVIDQLLDTEQITEAEYSALAYYRDQASLAEKSPVRSCCVTSASTGRGPGVAILSAMLETGRIERDLGGLYEIARAVAVDDLTLSQWCVQKYGGRERYGKGGKFVAIVPVNEKRHMQLARLEIRMAARRIVR